MRQKRVPFFKKLVQIGFWWKLKQICKYESSWYKRKYFSLKTCIEYVYHWLDKIILFKDSAGKESTLGPRVLHKVYSRSQCTTMHFVGQMKKINNPVFNNHVFKITVEPLTRHYVTKHFFFVGSFLRFWLRNIYRRTSNS